MKIDHLSKPKQKMVSDSISKGLNLNQCGNNEIFILTGKTGKSRGVLIFEDGTITRTGIDSKISKNLTISDARKLLRI
jgi:hypothetical protein